MGFPLSFTVTGFELTGIFVNFTAIKPKSSYGEKESTISAGTS